MNIKEMINGIKLWINHTSEGYARREEDLIYFDKLWNSIKNIIIEIEKQDTLSEKEQDILKMIKYDGVVYRVHKKYDKRKKYFGINESAHYYSWTKTSNLLDLHKVYKDTNYLIIKANTTNKIFGIDLNGLNDYINKYYDDSFVLGSPAIYREKEIVFPMLYETIESYEIKKIND